jgi:tRNA A37 threonylcarbamoyltransferase TsaD
LIDKLLKPSGISEHEALKRAAEIVQRAVKNGLTGVEVFRFPNALCTDNGRAINMMEPGWENTLTGLPKEMYS